MYIKLNSKINSLCASLLSFHLNFVLHWNCTHHQVTVPQDQFLPRYMDRVHKHFVSNRSPILDRWMDGWMYGLTLLSCYFCFILYICKRMHTHMRHRETLWVTMGEILQWPLSWPTWEQKEESIPCTHLHMSLTGVDLFLWLPLSAQQY